MWANGSSCLLLKSSLKSPRLLYNTISHFSREYTIIYISQMASYARFINFAPTEEPSAHWQRWARTLLAWEIGTTSWGLNEGLLYDPHSIRFSSRINSAVYLEACSSAHMQILSYSIKTHVAHVIFFHKRERTDFELISQRLPDVKLS